MSTAVPSYKWERTFLVNTDDVYKLFMSECAQVQLLQMPVFIALTRICTGGALAMRFGEEC